METEGRRKMQVKLSERESKRRRITNINQELPPHMIQVILSKLPVFSLPACRIVCTAWNNLVLDYASICKSAGNTFVFCTRDSIYSNLESDSDRLFVRKPKIHCIDFNLRRSNGRGLTTLDSSFGFEDSLSYIKIVNSCNGFLFVYKLTDDSSTTCGGIMNLMTNEFIKLPIVNDDQETYAYGLGFSPKTERYKLARVSKFCSTLEILTFGGIGSNQWRYVHGLSSYTLICENGIYFDGALYWIGREGDEDEEDDVDKSQYGYVICRLDVENERIEERISLVEVGPPRKASIGVVNGCYLYAALFFMVSPYRIQVWKMVKIGGEESWSASCVIDDIPNNWALQRRPMVEFQIIKLIGHGDALCLVNGDCFVMYDLNNGKVKKIWTKSSLDLNESGRRDLLWVRLMESFNFSSPSKILTVDDG